MTALSDLVHNPAGTGDLTTLFEQSPKLAQLAATAFPNLIEAMNASQTQLDNLREYTPDVVAALTNVGQASGYYDANGHSVRVQPTFFAFGTDSSNQLVARNAGRPLSGAPDVRSRCPGGGIQPAPDGSSPEPVANCQPARPRPDHDEAMRRLALLALVLVAAAVVAAVATASGGPGGDPYDVRAIFDEPRSR